MEKAQNYSLLYVDDEEANLRAFRNTFRRDFAIDVAGSAREALDLLANKSYHLIITDQRMPDISGVELLSTIMETYPDIPPSRLIVSGYAPPEDINEAFEKYNLFGFVSKPWKYEELKQEIYNAIGESQHD